MNRRNRLAWIDLEMTGLDPHQDVILEIATIITDGNLSLCAHGPSLVIHQPEERLAGLDSWVNRQHTQSGLLEQVRNSSISVQEAEEKTMVFLREWCEPRTALLAGNSVWNDRMFLSAYMPSIVDFLHYRLVDVSSFKAMLSRWYPDKPQVSFKKKERHRALEDIEESIAELRYYREHFFV